MPTRRNRRPETQGWLRRNTYLLLGASAWSVLVGASLGMSLRIERQGVANLALAEARMACQALTQISPSLMARQAHDLGNSGNGMRGHITSLNPVSPKDRPDDWERNALKRLAAGAAETTEIRKIGGRSYLSLMHSLVIEPNCLHCHAGQGYKVGDIRGGLSVDVPMAPIWDANRPHALTMLAGHGLIWLIGLGALALAARATRRRTRERRESDAKFRDLFDNAPVAYHEIDRDGVIGRVNRAECELLGFEAGEMVGRPVWAFVAGADRETSRAAIRRKLSGVQPLAPVQRRYVRSDGGEVLLEIHDSLVKNAAGETAGIRSALLDITERQRAEEALRASERRFRELFESSSDALFLIAADTGQIIEANNMASVLYGYGRDELLTRKCTDLSAEPEETLLCTQETRTEPGQVFKIPLRLHRRKDGSVFPVDITARSLIRKEQAVLPVSSRDITDRKRAEEALRESETRFNQLAEQSGTITWEVDAQGLYTYVSHVSEAVWGYHPDELAGRMHFYDLHPEEGREAFKTAAFAVFERKEPFQNLVNAVERKDGRIVWVSTNGLPLLNPDGTLRGYCGGDTDVTERKRAEEELRENENSLRESQIIAGLGSYVLDVPTGCWKSSAVLDEVFGIDEAHERSVEGWIALVHPGDRTMIADYLRNEVLGQGRTFDKEYRIIRHDDQAERWVHGRGELEFDAHGRLRSMRGTIQDITERKRAEEVLRESRERHRAILRTAMDGFWLADTEGRLLEVNETYCRMSGYSARELLTMRIADLMAAETADDTATHIQRIIAQGEARFESRHRRKDGSVLDVEVSIQYRPAEGGRFVAFLQDITERKRMKEELRAKEQLLSESQSIAHVGSWSWDLTTDVSALQWSPETYRLHGVSPDTFVPSGETLLSLIHPDDRGSMQTWLGACLAGEEPPALEFRTSLPDGSVRYIHGCGNLVRDAENKPVRMVGIAQDITERKRAEEEIRASKEEFDRFFALIPDLAAVASTDGFFKKLNPAWEKTLGFSIAELLSQPLESFILPDDVLTTRQEILSQVNGESTIGFVNRYRTKAGGYRWLEWMATPVLGGSWLYATGRDITERKQAEERIDRYLEDLESAREEQEKNSADLARMVEQLAVEKDRAEAATRAKSDFLSSMSHEIRTPMNGVIGMTGLLLDTPLTPEQQSYAEIVRSSGESLLGIINDILDLSKIEAGRLDLEVVPFNLHNALKDVVELLAVAAREKNLELLFRYAPGTPREFLGDPGRIRQVALNLIGNAIKFTERGHVVVDAGGMAISEGWASVRIAVRDTGIGIPADRQQMLFRKFQQLDSSTTRKHGGTGLGLVISKQLVELMGGTLSLVSQAGEGSTLSIEMPLRVNPLPLAEAKQGQGKDPGAPPCFAGRRVLLVEDDLVNQMLGAATLGKLGCQVDVAANGREALDMTSQLYDLIFMDCQMPEMDGYQATGEIRKREGVGRHTPIIALTAGAMAEDRERCVQAGMDDYVSKPFRAGQLREMLDKYLGPDRPIRAH